MTTLNEDARKLAKIRKQRDQAREAYEELKAQHAELEYELLERMEGEECHGTKTGGFNFVPQETVMATVQDREAFIQWAKRNEPELLEPRERKLLLNQFVREHLDNNQPLPEGLGFYVRRKISQRAA